LQLEGRSQKSGKCLPTGLGKGKSMDEPTMGNHPEMPQEGARRQGKSANMPTNLEECTLVEDSDETTSRGTTTGDTSKIVPQPSRGTITTPKMGNPIHFATRLTTKGLTTALRQLECQHDIPLKQRMAWVKEALDNCQTKHNKGILENALQRLKRNQSKPKYPVFYNLKPLLEATFKTDRDLAKINMEELLDLALLQLRLTTLMRSVDAANMTWAIYTQGTRSFLKTTGKTGTSQVYSVQGKTLETIRMYLYRHMEHPAQTMFRYTKEPQHCLGPERIAKRVLAKMEQLGININIFKAHSLRGATATHLLKTGASKTLVQARGHWTSTQTLDDYYNRLHQEVDWEEILLGEHETDRQASTCAVLPPSFSITKPTEEGESLENKGGCTAQELALIAQGIQRDLFEQVTCPECKHQIHSEAAYRCEYCLGLYHVRCLVRNTEKSRDIYRKNCKSCKNITDCGEIGDCAQQIGDCAQQIGDCAQPVASEIPGTLSTETASETPSVGTQSAGHPRGGKRQAEGDHLETNIFSFKKPRAAEGHSMESEFITVEVGSHRQDVGTDGPLIDDVMGVCDLTK